MDGRPNRRKNDAFSNLYGLLYSGSKFELSSASEPAIFGSVAIFDAVAAACLIFVTSKERKTLSDFN